MRSVRVPLLALLLAAALAAGFDRRGPIREPALEHDLAIAHDELGTMTDERDALAGRVAELETLLAEAEETLAVEQEALDRCREGRGARPDGSGGRRL